MKKFTALSFLLSLVLASSALAEGKSRGWTLSPATTISTAAVSAAIPDLTTLSNLRHDLDLPIITDSCVSDREGDARTQHPEAVIDLLGICAGTNGRKTRIVLKFSAKSTLKYTTGFIFLDTDQDAGTGENPWRFEGFPSQDVGFEYLVSLFEIASALERGQDPFVQIQSRQGSYYSPAELDFSANTVTFEIELDFLKDDGNIDMAVIVGDTFGPTDVTTDVLRLLEARGVIYPGSTNFLDSQTFELGVLVETGNSPLVALPQTFINGRKVNFLQARGVRIDGTSRRNAMIYVVPGFQQMLWPGKNIITVGLITTRGIFGDEVEVRVISTKPPMLVPFPPPPPPIPPPPPPSGN